ncbi:PREDICTED: protein phosphatase 1B-like isoform X2 [Priapulus caudatus]|uniref:Protein phosphatase 1B-like isoform X2 n=1 Tax=Priapulus caudatus TaxID=37621 RepID=A0ABM1E9N1_PRICU|nr:PREDICTED: protein phosphatase 1B-like isoform X2 [Priapulus caudatus]
MGAFLEKPKTDKHNEHGSGNGLRFGVSSMQGWRIEMEDAHSAVVGLPHGLKDWSFFAVYDGHAGAKVSAHCAEHLLPAIVNAESFKSSMKGTQLCPTSDNVVHGVREGFLVLDETMRQLPEIQSGEDKSGSTAVCVLLSPMHIYFGNCGDSRAILCRDRKLFFSTQDHKPVNPVEKDRIQKAGGSVMIQRVNGSLAVSRALGDYEYKQVEGKGQCEQLVSPEPEVFMQERDCEKDEFLVLACDGVWDVMSNEDVCEFVSSRLAICDNFESICNQLVDTCLYKGSRDNMSVVLVAFQGAPKLSKEAIDKENELDALLEKRIQQIVESGDNPEEVGLCDVIHLLANEDIPSLPPGGGLCAKRSAIKSIFNRLYPNQNNDSNREETL